jgi:hypothetical protein
VPVAIINDRSCTLSMVSDVLSSPEGVVSTSITVRSPQELRGDIKRVRKIFAVSNPQSRGIKIDETPLALKEFQFQKKIKGQGTDLVEIGAE